MLSKAVTTEATPRVGSSIFSWGPGHAVTASMGGPWHACPAGRDGTEQDQTLQARGGGLWLLPAFMPVMSRALW